MKSTMQPKTHSPSAYLRFSREQWCEFRKDTPMTLTEEDLAKLQGKNEVVSLVETEEIYLPLSRLLSLYVTAAQSLHRASREFLGTREPKVPYIIGVAGSVAVGKSTTARILQAMLSRWPNHPHVALVTTDGFLYSNAELERQGLMDRKGFPESYDLMGLLRFIEAIKSGQHPVKAPIYSHHHYDIVPDEYIEVDRADIVIIEGLNILQTGAQRPNQPPRIFVSDYLDFSIFVDADSEVIKRWFIDRLLLFSKAAFKEQDAYFHYLSKLTQEETVKFAERVWREINEVNLLENILPYRERAHLILRKAQDHSVQDVLLRKL